MTTAPPTARRSTNRAALAIVAVLELLVGSCASGPPNPSLDDYSDGVVSFASAWHEAAWRGSPLEGAWREGAEAAATGPGPGPGAATVDLGAVTVTEEGAPPPRDASEPFDSALRRFVDSSFETVERHEVRVVAFERDGRSRRATLRPYFEGTARGGGRRIETGLWDVRLEPAGPSWRIASLRQLRWRSALCRLPLFEDRTAAAGLARAVHEAARPVAVRNVPMPGEHLPPGIAILDADGDGRDDLFLCGGRGNRFFRNRGDGTFVDATAASGLAGHPGKEAVGAVAFDYDGDGVQDLYVTYFDGPNLLFRGRGDGTFEEVGTRAGVDLLDWCTSAVAFDYDRDGHADLYVLVYGRPERGPTTTADNAAPNRLFHNNGDGTFTDVTKASGTGHTGWALAAAALDADEDGWPDLYVANDFGAHVLYRNRRDGTFENVADRAGVRDDGFGMGVAVADFDGDSHLDFFVSNYSFPEKWFLRDRRFPMPPFPYSLMRPIVSRRLSELARGSSLFRWAAPLRYERVSEAADVWDTSWSWGAVFVDALLRGRPDLFSVNGMISGKSRTEHEIDFWNSMSRNWIEMERQGTPPGDFGEDSLWGYLAKRFFLNLDGSRFADVAGIVGLSSEGNQRGLAVLDADGDGAPDLLAAGFLQPPQLWVNLNPEGNRSLVVTLRGAGPAPEGSGAPTAFRSTRDALGAVVAVEAGGRRATQVLLAGDSYLSSSSKKLFFGLGKDVRATRVIVRWPSGKVTVRNDAPAGRLELSEPGTGPASTPEELVRRGRASGRLVATGADR